jgi:hypothetical protein
MAFSTLLFLIKARGQIFCIICLTQFSFTVLPAEMKISWKIRVSLTTQNWEIQALNQGHLHCLNSILLLIGDKIKV